MIANDSEKGKSLEEVESWTPFAGGAPCNVATALGMLGVDVSFVGALGNDARGDELVKIMTARNVNTSAIQRRCEPTRDVYVTRTADGEREFAGFGLPTNQYCDNFLQADKLPVGVIQEAPILVTGTLGLAAPETRTALYKAVQTVKSSQAGLVFVDVNWRPVFWSDLEKAREEITSFLEEADIVKISDADLEWLYGVDIDAALKNPCEVSRLLPTASGVLITAGEMGAAYCFHSTDGDKEAVDTVDTTGAGDAFTAGFIYKLLEAGGLQNLVSDPKRMKEAVVFASAVGALTTTGKGAIEPQPKLEDVEALFEESKQWTRFW
eukprot:gene1156-3960_t